jgi:hypothetical protein
MRAQLERQVKRMREVIAQMDRKLPGIGMERDQLVYHTDLTAVVEAATGYHIQYRVVSPGLLLGCYRMQRRSLYARLTKPIRNAERYIGDPVTQVRNIVAGPSPFNCLRKSTFHYALDDEPYLVPGMIPFFWWDIPTEVARRIIFKQSTVLVMANPAYLIDLLCRAGLKVRKFEPPNILTLETPLDGPFSEMHYCGYLLDLPLYSLFRETEIVTLVMAMLAHAEQKKNEATSMQVRLRHQLYPPDEFAPAGQRRARS